MLNASEIEIISMGTCRDMLGLEFESACLEPSHELPVCASIRISGDIEAVVEIATNETAANLITQTMCCLSCDQIEERDISDTLGEVVNIIGGNIKGAMSGSTELSLPSVSLRESREVQSNTHASVTANFLVSNHPFQVRLSSLANG